MAITDVGKLAESSANGRVVTLTTGIAAKAGHLLLLYLGGKHQFLMTPVTVRTSTGEFLDWWFRQSNDRGMGLAWKRLDQPLPAGSTITVTWNRKPYAAWASAHAFEGAAGTPFDVGHTISASNSTNAAHTVATPNADALVVATVIAPYDWGISDTPLNSMTKQDDNGASSAGPWIGGYSRNISSGTSFQAGTAIPLPVYWGCAAACFAFEAMPAGRTVFVMT